MSTKPIRVLQFVGDMDYGGIETWLMHVWRHIDRTKFQFDFCYTEPTPGAYAPEIELLGGRMVACPLDKRNPFGFARRLRALLREAQYSVVHSHTHHFSGFVVRLAHEEKVPVRIAHCHSTSDGKASGPSRILYHALMKHWIRKYATHGLAASEAAAGALFGKAWRSDSRFRVLYCGIDLEPFRQEVSREEVRRELRIPLDVAVVGHVGSFRPPKNHAFLLRIAGEVIKLRPEVRFLLVGDGDLRPQMQALARELGIEKNVIFTGARSDVPRLMLGAMDVFVFPSLWEGLPIALLEAQVAGLRCLVSHVVTPEAIVIGEVVEYLSLKDRAGKWAERVVAALHTHRVPRMRILDALVNSGRDIQGSCRCLLQLYEEAVAGTEWQMRPYADLSNCK